MVKKIKNYRGSQKSVVINVNGFILPFMREGLTINVWYEVQVWWRKFLKKPLSTIFTLLFLAFIFGACSWYLSYVAALGSNAALTTKANCPSGTYICHTGDKPDNISGNIFNIGNTAPVSQNINNYNVEPVKELNK